MFIQDEIKICIKAYQQALIPQNLNWKYIRNNSMEHGLCNFCDINKLNLLNEFLRNEDFFYICDTPLMIYVRNESNYLEVHSKRIEYLENLLTTI
jgi:hypothetical protein